MGKKRGAGITRTQYAAFRGADFSTDPSLVESCRSPLCTNIVADGGGMPQKRLGWRTVQNLGDTVYGAKKPVPGLQGQCLHAVGLRFVHPRTGEMVELSCPLPEEFREQLRKLEARM